MPRPPKRSNAPRTAKMLKKIAPRKRGAPVSDSSEVGASSHALDNDSGNETSSEKSSGNSTESVTKHISTEPRRKRARPTKTTTDDDDVEKVIQSLLSVSRKRTATAISNADKQWQSISNSLASSANQATGAVQSKGKKLEELLLTRFPQDIPHASDTSVSEHTAGQDALRYLVRSAGDTITARIKERELVTAKLRSSFEPPAQDMLGALRTLDEMQGTLIAESKNLAQRRRRLNRTYTRGVDALLDPGVMENSQTAQDVMPSLAFNLAHRPSGYQDALSHALAGTDHVPAFIVTASGMLRAGWGACMM